MSEVDDRDDSGFEDALLAAYRAVEGSTTPPVLEQLRRRSHPRTDDSNPTRGAHGSGSHGSGAAGGDPDGKAPLTTDAASADPSARYRVLGEVGRGGVGVVFAGRDLDLNRDVAMKMLHAEHEADPAILARFVEEAQIGGQLQHPGIVPVYEIGLQDGVRPFIAMKLVQGRTLADLLAERGRDAAASHRLLAIFEQVCQSVAYAHSRGVVHRDLKPANVMVGAFGEVMVMDWGFAKVLASRVAGDATPPDGVTADAAMEGVATARSSDPRAQSMRGSVFGTPAYMPPEQANGEVDRMDQRSDVFSLGAMLCELLAGRPAYVGDRAEVLAMARRGDTAAAAAALGACGAAPPLITLARDCLAAAIESRPADAGAVAARLAAHRAAVEQRARDAELAAAAAEIRTRAARRMAATIVSAITLGVVGWFLVANAAAARRAHATRLVTDALEDARQIYGEASGTSDVGAWQRATAVADTVRGLASSDDVQAELRQRAAALDEQIRAGHARAIESAETRARDERLLARLRVLRMPADDDVARPSWPHDDARRLDRGYAEAFVERGFDLDRLEPTVAAAALDLGPSPAEVSVALDHWIAARRVLANDPRLEARTEPNVAHLAHVARALDGDQWRRRLDTACVDPQGSAQQLRELAVESAAIEQPPLSLFLLGDALLKAGEIDGAIELLGRAVERHPGDYLLTFWLGIAHQRRPDPDATAMLAAFHTARAIAPDQLEVRHRIGMVHEWRNDLTQARRVFEQLAAADPGNAHWQQHLGKILVRSREGAAGVEVLRRCAELAPELPSAHAALAWSLQQTGDADGADAAFRRALALDERFAPAHFELGLALAERGDSANGLVHLRRAFELSGNPEHLWSVAKILQNQGDLAAARATFEQTIVHDPKFAEGYFGLAVVQRDAGEAEAAHANLQRALDLVPSRAKYLARAGLWKAEDGDYATSCDLLERAVAADPEHVQTHFWLAESLSRAHRFEQSHAAMRRGHELGSRRRTWQFPSAEWVAQAERLVEMARGWEAILRGETPDAPLDEWLAAARHAEVLGRTHAAARAYAAALRDAEAHSNDGVPMGTRAQAARTALRAACGDGSDAAELHVDERAAHRHDALRWLQAEFAARAIELQSDATTVAAAARAELAAWREAREFDSVRGDAALAKLPQAQAEQWSRLWHALDAALD